MSRALSSDLVNWNKLDHDGKASTQAKDFTTILADMLKISFASFTTQSPWLMGTTLHISLPQPDFEKLKIKIAEVADRCYSIVTFWVDENEDAVYLRMCIEVWQAARSDSKKGCRTLSMVNGLPADSPHRSQLIKVYHNSRTTDRPAYSVRGKSASYPGDQDLFHFLRMSTRLSSISLDTYKRVLSVDSEGSLDSDKIIAQAVTSEDRSMLTVACTATQDARAQGLFSRLGETMTPDGLDWLDFELKQQLSFADRSFEGQWGVVVHLPGVPAAMALEKRRPSFFVPWSGDSPFGSQVHILDVKVIEHSYCMLISSSRKPSRDECKGMAKELEEKLNVPSTGKSWVTHPFKKELAPWFRADGVLDKHFKEQVINKQAEKVTAESRVCEARPEGLLYVPTDSGSDTAPKFDPGSDPVAMIGPRGPVVLILVTRQSGDDGDKTRTTIPKQATTLLGSRLLFHRQEGDTIIWLVEMCSSNQHDFDERIMMSHIPRSGDKPIFLMSVNPDRVTRRPEEVPIILKIVQDSGGVWVTQGLPMGEGTSNETWTVVEGDAVEVLMKRLAIDRQRALEAGTPNRGDSMATRVNDAISRSTETLPQIAALHDVFDWFMACHGFTNILLVARNLPNNSNVEKISGNGSQNRQLQFLRNMLPPAWREANPDAIFEWKAFRSAYTDDFVNGLGEQLTKIGGKTLILMVRPDQVVKSMTQLSRLEGLLCEGDNGAMSFQWDYKTCLEVGEALQLDQEQSKHPSVQTWATAWKDSNRAVPGRGSWPTVQLHLWCFKGKTSETAIRHVKDADECSQAIKLSSYQGGDYVDPHFLERGKRGFNAPTQQKYQAYFEELFPSDKFNAKIIFPPKDGSYNCRCEGKGKSEDHDPECQCACSYCVRQRSCPCEDWAKCECPPICNCNCADCHKTLTDEEKAKKLLKSELSKKRKREQADDAQAVPAGAP
ncbi:unnamed protein product [Zymoseptoria tritici ST99CH_3D1]|nr:unnamed protein product [Zymoseptoria tritici ST99CH_3D1]